MRVSRITIANSSMIESTKRMEFLADYSNLFRVRYHLREPLLASMDYVPFRYLINWLRICARNHHVGAIIKIVWWPATESGTTFSGLYHTANQD